MSSHAQPPAKASQAAASPPDIHSNGIPSGTIGPPTLTPKARESRLINVPSEEHVQKGHKLCVLAPTGWILLDTVPYNHQTAPTMRCFCAEKGRTNRPPWSSSSITFSFLGGDVRRAGSGWTTQTVARRCCCSDGGCVAVTVVHGGWYHHGNKTQMIPLFYKNTSCLKERMPELRRPLDQFPRAGPGMCN